MRKVISFLLVVIFVFILVDGNTHAQNETGILKDSRDGQVYPTVKIGDTWWMAEDLSFQPDKGKFSIWKRDKNNPRDVHYLYDFETAKNICPAGWKLPDKVDFESLLNHFGRKEKEKYFALISGGISNFSASLNGYRPYGVYSAGNNACYWSSSSIKDVYALYVSALLISKYGKKARITSVIAGPHPYGSEVAVRCIKEK